MKVHRFQAGSEGRRISAQWQGAEGRPWLLLSNSLATDRRMWAPQIERLAQSYRVIRYDARGHGESDVPPGEYALADLTADMIAVLDAAGAAQADLVGVSLGGMTALGLALAAPDRVRRLAVCNARAQATAPYIAAWDDKIAQTHTGGMAAIADDTLARWFTPRADPRTLAAAQAMILGTPAAGYLGCIAALKSLDMQQRLPGLTVPVCYFAGAEDLAAPPAVMREMAAATPGAAYHEFAGAAHLANMEQPEAFTDAVLGWLAG